MATMQAMKHIEIFRTGTHTDIAGVKRPFTDADLQEIAGSYNPELHEAPLVIGHPQLDAPSWGWVKSLRVEGSRLLATPDQVQPAFSEAVESGAYKKVSAALYSRDDPNNPTPGRWHLRHVGFLGAQPPAIKGLAGPVFGEGDTLDKAVVIEFSESADPSDAEKGKPDPATTSNPSATPSPNDSPNQEQTVTPEEIAALQAENAALKAEKEARIKREAEEAAAARVTEHTAFAESLVSEAKLPESDKARIVAIANALNPAGGQPVMFGEGDSATPLYEQFKDFLQGLPPAVSFGEQAKASRAAITGQGGGQAAEYAEGTDPAAIELDKKIRDYMDKNKVSYAAAFNAVNK